LLRTTKIRGILSKRRENTLASLLHPQTALAHPPNTETLFIPLRQSLRIFRAKEGSPNPRNFGILEARMNST
jgi:hypothetical protein